MDRFLAASAGLMNGNRNMPLDLAALPAAADQRLLPPLGSGR
ncbi:hypothetical protein [Limobrevibacterium gyesilva]|uniref:Uncharacterized protein n=1 Tax=Limobrevibacterium gyesilva TaxID=2991712 RepID=A0AA41YS93_9PROT|nr:hypothetical protein [Limobrevibacterium gyesilva]MCW3477607.1 hypothetical protein [Limobrevibacterium gyesilva]